MYQLHTTDQIAFVIQERRREAAANQLVARAREARPRSGRAPRFALGPALHHFAALTRLDHLHVRPARG